MIHYDYQKRGNDAMIEATEILPNAVYTLEEACHLLKIGEATARRWIKAGRLRGRRIGRGYRFLGSDLIFSLAAQESPSFAPKPLRPDSPFLKLAGRWASGKTDISEKHDEYFAEAIRSEWQ